MNIDSKIKEKIVLALDVDGEREAKRLIEELKDYVGIFKVGLQIYTSLGDRLFSFMNEEKLKYFLDVKFMDIPNTVAKASGNIIRNGADFFNVHALGGIEMMRMAVESANVAAEEVGKSSPIVLAVTVLTSISNQKLNEELDIPHNVNDYAMFLAQQAKTAGCSGVVASAFEARKIKEVCGKDFKVLCPGIRPKWSATNDQKRLATPSFAIDEGADFIVIGRAVTSSDDKKEAMNKIYNEIGEYYESKTIIR